MRVIIFYNNAVKPNEERSHTDIFEGVDDVVYTGRNMQFTYDGKSTGTRNHAFFNLDLIAGYSLIK